MNELFVVASLVITIALLGYLAWEVNHNNKE